MGKVFCGDKNKKGQFSMKVTDVLFFWAKVDEPETKFGTKTGEMEYSVKVLVGQAVVDKLEGMDLNKEFKEVYTSLDRYKKEKEKNKFKNYIEYAVEAEKSGETLYLATFSQRAETEAGKKLYVKVVGRNGEVDLGERIGNGSFGNFRLFCYPGTVGGPSEGKINSSLNAIQVSKLVEYVESEFSEEGLGDVGFGNMDEDEDEGGSTDSKPEVADDGSANPFAEFSEED